jgi:hypothetical protein
MNLAETIIPKSDQLNADDLISGPITVKVTAVKGSNEPQQPVSIHYEGDNGKPYKPCKSMRRVLVSAWGANGADYVGRSMTLYRDDSVVFGGIAVGGIRISHLSHIERDLTIALTVSRASRKPYTVKVLTVKADPVAAIEAAQTIDELLAAWKSLTPAEKALPTVVVAKDKKKEELTTKTEEK